MWYLRQVGFGEKYSVDFGWKRGSRWCSQPPSSLQAKSTHHFSPNPTCQTNTKCHIDVQRSIYTKWIFIFIKMVQITCFHFFMDSGRRVTMGKCTGILSQIGTKLRVWEIGQAGASCYSWAALSSNNWKTLYQVPVKMVNVKFSNEEPII